MNIYTIYAAYCITTGLYYIGFDSNWPKRQKDHITWSKPQYKKYKEHYYKFHQDIRNLGFENFEWFIIYQSTDKLHTLKIMEPIFIERYNSFNNGYNMTSGGDGRTTNHTPETILKMKQRIPWNKGIKTGPQLKEHAEKAGNARKGKLRGPYKGKTEYSPKWKNIISEKSESVQIS